MIHLKGKALPGQAKYLPFLDGFRGLAVLMVFWTHFPFVSDWSLSRLLTGIGRSLGVSHIGVDFFFVLSGFLITRGLLFELHTTGRVSTQHFYLKRVLRIFPIYFLSAAFCLALFPAARDAAWEIATYLYNYYKPFHLEPMPLEHTWSLCVEEQFYLLWPFILTVIPHASGRIITGLLIPTISVITAVSLALLADPKTAAEMVHVFGPTRMLSLSFGAYLAFCEASDFSPSTFRTISWIVLGVAILGMAQIGRVLQAIPSGGLYWCVVLVGSGMLSLGVLKTLLFGQGWAPNAARSLLSSRPLRHVGRISYGLYLYHLPILFLAGIPPYRTETTGVAWWQLSTVLALTFLVAELSYRYLERPLLDLKRRFVAAPKSGTPTGEQGAAAPVAPHSN